MSRSAFLSYFSRSESLRAYRSRLPLRLEMLEGREVPSTNIPLNGTNWTALGPTVSTGTTIQTGNLTASGPVSGVAVDATNPNIIYATGYTSGVAKTVDGGANWTHLTDHLPSTTVVRQDATILATSYDNFRTLNASTIALSTLDSNRAYVGQGDNAVTYYNVPTTITNAHQNTYVGYGLMRTLDGGSTWDLNRGPVDGTHPNGAFASTNILKIQTLPNPAFPADKTKELVYVLVGSAGKNFELYLSKNGGDTFTRINGLLNSTSTGGNNVDITVPLSDFAVDPTNPNVVYIAVSDPTNRNNGSQGAAVFYAQNGIYRSTNALGTAANVSWEIKFGGTGTFIPGNSLRQLKIGLAANAPNVLYVGGLITTGGDPTPRVYRSSDSGVNWQQYAGSSAVPNTYSPSLASNIVAVNPNNPDMVVLAGSQEIINGGGIGSILYTQDATATNNLLPSSTWSDVTTSTTSATPGQYVQSVVYSTDSSGNAVIIVGTRNGVFKSTVFTADSKTGLFSTNWLSLNGSGANGLGFMQLNSVALSPNSSNLILTGSSNQGILTFSDPGNQPSSTAQANLLKTIYGSASAGGNAYALNLVYDYINPQIVYSALSTDGISITVFKSLDGGATWAAAGGTGSWNGGQNLLVPTGAFSRPALDGRHQMRSFPLVIDPSDHTRLAMAGFTGQGVLLSTDSGATWSISVGTFGGNEHIASTAAPRPIPYTTAGKDRTSALINSSDVTAIAIPRSNPNFMYVAVDNWIVGTNEFGPGLMRIDLSVVNPQTGKSPWLDVSPSINKHINNTLSGSTKAPEANSLTSSITSIAVDPFDANTLYVTTADGPIWKSNDGGITWSLMSNVGLPALQHNGDITQILVDPNRSLGTGVAQTDDILYVATNQGVFFLFNPTQSANLQSWIRVGGNEFPDVQVSSIALNTTTGILAAATYGRGLYAIQIRPYVSGSVFIDNNGNGIFDNGETFVANTRVVAFDLSTNSQVASTFTSNDGSFIFNSLPNSTYEFRADTVNGIQTTTPVAARTQTVNQQTTVNGINIGTFQRTTISGTVFSDLNRNGKQDSGETTPVANAPLTLRHKTTVSSTTYVNSTFTVTSDANGNYTFSDIPTVQDTSVAFDSKTGYQIIPWEVVDVPRPDWVFTTKEPIQAPTPITLQSGVPVSNIIVGEFNSARLFGNVYDDANANGIKESGETGRVNWLVLAINTATSATTTATTDASGNYALNGLLPGTYQIREVDQAGFVRTTNNPADVTTSQSTIVNNLDFGIFQAANLTGQLFIDTNGDGKKQGTETGTLGGATVGLIDPRNNSTVATATTNGSGVYTFSGIFPLGLPGGFTPYTVRVLGPSTYFQTTPDLTVSLLSNQTTSNQNFGVFQRVSISGTAFVDRNANGLLDVGDTQYAFSKLSLIDPTNGVIVYTTTTDGSGIFTFTNVGPLLVGAPPAPISFQFSAQASGYFTTTPAVNMVLSSGVNVGGQLVGLATGPTYNGTVYDDLNGNGARDSGEPGLAGVTMELVNTSSVVVSRVTTDTAGVYSFTALPGTYSVHEVPPTGSTTSTTNPSAPVAGAVGNTITNDFGTFRFVTISGVAYHDQNGNQQYDVGEALLSKFPIQLFDSKGNLLQSTTTDGVGHYSFSGIGAGTITVQETPLTPWTPSGPSAVTFAPSSGATPTVNFGNFTPNTLTGKVFEDINQNGSLDGSETGISGWTVQLLNSSNTVIATTTVDSAGNYTFSTVPPGTFRVQLAPRQFWTQIGTVPPVTVVSSQTVAFANLASIRLGSIAGTAFVDTNRDGFKNVFEHAIAGVGVELLNGAGTVIAQTITDSSGSYIFGNLTAGTYTVRVFQKPIGLEVTGVNRTYTLNVKVGSTVPGTINTGKDFALFGNKRYALAADGGGGPRVQVYDAITGSVLQDFFAYEVTFTGGVRVASADVNADGVDDLVVAAGPGGGPRVRAFDGLTGNVLLDYFAYEPTFTNGLYVAVGDVNNDGFSDIITGTDAGGAPRVTVYSGKDGSQLADYFAYDSSFRGGVRIGAGDVYGDATANVITAPGPGGAPTVVVWDIAGGAQAVTSFNAFDPSYTGGVYVSGSTPSPSGRSYIIAGSGDNYPTTPVVRIYDGSITPQILEVPAFFPGADGAPFTSAVRVTSFDQNGDGVPDIVIASGPGGPSRVRTLSGANFRQLGVEINPFEASFHGGVFIG